MNVLCSYEAGELIQAFLTASFAENREPLGNCNECSSEEVLNILATVFLSFFFFSLVRYGSAIPIFGAFPYMYFCPESTMCNYKREGHGLSGLNFFQSCLKCFFLPFLATEKLLIKLHLSGHLHKSA